MDFKKMVKRAVKTKTKHGAKRDLFAELSEGMKALAEERLGKRTLRTVRPQPPICERSRK
jgi:hypothetical protein